jgi:hypothetical protein
MRRLSDASAMLSLRLVVQSGSDLVQKLSAAILGIVLALGVLEIGLRLFPSAISPRLLILFGTELRERIAAGTFALRRDFRRVARDDGGPPLFVPRSEAAAISVDEHGGEPRVDEMGFCNPPGSYRDSEVIDWIAIGDSFTWCHDVTIDKAWIHQLGLHAGRRVYNLGRGGSGPYEYVQLLRRFGIRKRPRLVLLNVYEGNDLRDAAYYWRYRDEVARTGHRPSDEPPSVLPIVTEGALGRVSYAANLLVAFASRAWARDAADLETSAIDFRYWIGRPDGDIPFNADSREATQVFFARRLVQGTVSADVWDAALVRFVELAHESHFTPLVTYIPSPPIAYAASVRFADPELEPLLDHASRAQREFLARRASELGYLFHDLTPAIQAAIRRSPAGPLLYDPKHLHLTDAGHAVVAASLLDVLQDKGADRE